MALKPELVRQSFAQLSGREEAFLDAFFTRLFEQYPEMKPLVPRGAAGNLERASLKALQLVLDGLDRPDQLSQVLAPYRARLAALKPVHYAAVGETLLATLSVSLKGKWSGELSRQWIYVYALATHGLRRRHAPLGRTA